ncbi:MAG: signal peptidase II [Mycoplasmoidaceae bacterium]
MQFKLFLKNIYTKKNILTKLISIIFTVIIVIIPAFVIRDFVLKKGKLNFDIIHNFIDGKVAFNSGIAFSIFGDHPGAVIALEIITISLVFILFLLNRFVVFDFGISLIFTSGLSNIIDRQLVDFFQGQIYYHKVVDYIQFHFIANSAIFNWQDMFVIIGIILLSLIIFFKIILIDKTKEVRDKNDKIY